MSACATITMYASRNENSVAVHSEKIEKPRCRSSSATQAKNRNTSISVMSRTSTMSFAGRVLSISWNAEMAAFAGNLATSTRTVHHRTAMMHLANAAYSTASLKASGERLHWLMMKLKMMTRLECIGFASSFCVLQALGGRPARSVPPVLPTCRRQCKLSRAKVYKSGLMQLCRTRMLIRNAKGPSPMKNDGAVLTQTGPRTAAYWMPFTHNRYLKTNPRSRVLARAEGAYYTTTEGQRLFDCLSGLWCCPLGHGHPKIAEAVAKQVKELDYSPAFQMGHPKIFSLAERLIELAPAGMGQVFFGNSCSEA